MPIGHGHFEDADIAMSRLAIIDVAGGSQPDREQRRALLGNVNGEIYNFRDLRAD